MVRWGMFNMISRAESLLNGGPWWWRPVGGVITLVVLFVLYFALS